MILIDWNGLAVGTIVMNKMAAEEDLIRHMILNQLRMYNKKFRKDYGQVVIACEGRSWRRDIFPQYKYKRKEAREDEKSTIDWDEVFRIINLVKEEVMANLPYKVVQVGNAEADDIIGVLAENTQEFGQYEPVMIVSNDKDFLQLQKFDNVAQYSPMKKKLIKEAHPHKYIVEHTCKGDSGDGIPNINSGDNCFVDGVRQTPVRQKLIDSVLEHYDDLQSVLSTEQLRNFQRNKKLIDLSEIPDAVKSEIINKYNEAKPAPKMKVLNYLIKKRCKLLIECVEEFY